MHLQVLSALFSIWVMVTKNVHDIAAWSSVFSLAWEWSKLLSFAKEVDEVISCTMVWIFFSSRRITCCALAFWWSCHFCTEVSLMFHESKNGKNRSLSNPFFFSRRQKEDMEPPFFAPGLAHTCAVSSVSLHRNKNGGHACSHHLLGYFCCWHIINGKIFAVCFFWTCHHHTQ